MSIESATMPFPVQLKTPIRLDPVLLAIVTTLLFGGLVVLASASISISDSTTNDPFFYVSRQAVAALLGGAAGFTCLFIPRILGERQYPVDQAGRHESAGI